MLIMDVEVEMKRIYSDPRPEGMVLNKGDSVINFCRACRGWDPVDGSVRQAVLRCDQKDCFLYNFRLPRRELIKESKYPTQPPRKDPIINQLGLRQVKHTESRWHVIKMMCRYCQCLGPKESRDPINNCQNKECWLWPHRNGKPEVDDEGSVQ